MPHSILWKVNDNEVSFYQRISFENKYVWGTLQWYFKKVHTLMSNMFKSRKSDVDLEDF